MAYSALGIDRPKQSSVPLLLQIDEYVAFLRDAELPSFSKDGFGSRLKRPVQTCLDDGVNELA